MVGIRYPVQNSKIMIRVTVLLFFLFLLPGCLIDNQDHSKCAPSLYSHSKIPVDFYGEVVLLPFSERNQKIFTEEDILLTDSTSFEDGVVRIGKLWENRTFYYKIHPSLPNKERVYEALDHWKNHLGDLILIVETTEDNQSPNYVEFIESEGCWSNVGMRGGRQEIGLESNCKTLS